jgi:hypothetical protein
MTAMSTLTAHSLASLFRKVAPHMDRDSRYAAIQGVRLDAGNRYLHAVATDRYTLAVARQQLRSDDPAWAATLPLRAVDTITAWLAGHEGAEHVHLTPGTDDLTVTSALGTLVLPSPNASFPDWRGLIRTALENAPTEAPWSGFTSNLLTRWEAAGRDLCTWQAAFDKPLIVSGHEFIGLQMPRRIHDDESPAEKHAVWAASLGGGDKVEQADTLHHYEHEELAAKENVVPDAAEDLLKQVLRSTTDLFSISTTDPGALAAYALAGGRAWMAYRLLKALEKSDPELLRATIVDTDEQLESGEIGEWAWDEAAAAGHDPQAWRNDYEAHLKKRAAKRAAEAVPSA